MPKSLLAVSLLSTVLVVSGCTVHQQSTGSLSGPSGLGLSLRLLATPDTVTQDGSAAAQSSISVTAFDHNGSSVAKTVQLTLNGPGTLSASAVSTPGSVTYIPPASTTGSATVVTIFASIVGTTGASSSIGGCSSQPCPLTAPQISLTLNPATALSPSAPLAQFGVNPSSPVTQQTATFDATSSCGTQLVSNACPGTSALTGFSWNFGDNSTATGQTVFHSFGAKGTYTVTLTVTNAQGRMASSSQIVTVTTVAPPAAVFSVSPNTLHANVTVANFNGAQSAAASNHQIVRYDWNFGDGTTASTTTSATTHLYTTVNTFKSTLTVTDDLGQQSTAEVDVTVGP